MRRFPLIACLFTLIPLLAWPSLSRAADPAAFTPEQRQQIIQIVREALKNDPSILREAVESLQADQQAREAADARARLASHRQTLDQQAGDPVAGNPQGDVTLVEFYDPRCPYCRRMLPAIADLLKTDPKIRLVYKDIPVLGPASEMETRAILAAQNQGGYEKMQHALMTNPAQPDVAMIRATAAHLGLDADRLLSDMYAAPVTAKIKANLALARELKVDGTPVWVAGENLITGAVDEAALAEAVAEARGKKS
jgi:protein-disulfide isomerase